MNKWTHIKKAGSFIVGTDPKNPHNPCPLCGIGMGALTICPNTHVHGKFNLKFLEREKK